MREPNAPSARARALGANKRCRNSWRGMKERCQNPKHVSWRDYGGRGISVCKRWKHPQDGFINFFNDMGNPPEGLSLDRIKTSGNYNPKNCRWAPPNEQLRNRRKIGALTRFEPSEIIEHVYGWKREDIVLLIRRVCPARVAL